MPLVVPYWVAGIVTGGAGAVGFGAGVATSKVFKYVVLTAAVAAAIKYKGGQ